MGRKPSPPMPRPVAPAPIRWSTPSCRRPPSGRISANWRCWPARPPGGPPGAAGGVLHRRPVRGVPPRARSAGPGIETIGFAGFFGLPVAHKARLGRGRGASAGSADAQMTSTSHEPPTGRTGRPDRRPCRARLGPVPAGGGVVLRLRRGGGAVLWRQAGAGRAGSGRQGRGSRCDAPRSSAIWRRGQGRNRAAVLKAMSLTEGHGGWSCCLGHGAQVTNNPHESAYHCGACGGYTGEVSARLLAGCSTIPKPAPGWPPHGIELPADTLFVAGLHDTTTDEITLYDDGARSRRGSAQCAAGCAGRPDGPGRAGAPAARGDRPDRSPTGRRLGRGAARMGACRLRRLHRRAARVTAGADLGGRASCTAMTGRPMRASARSS
jgi:hypothetical protein